MSADVRAAACSIAEFPTPLDPGTMITTGSRPLLSGKNSFALN
jgi:hypothetical protein